jgi:alkyl hydroperoxide reductase subunit AhpC
LLFSVRVSARLQEAALSLTRKMKMTDDKNAARSRYVVIVDPAVEIEAVSAELLAMGLTIDSRLDAIRALVVAGDVDTAAAAAGMRGVKSIEREGEVRTQD